MTAPSRSRWNTVAICCVAGAMLGWRLGSPSEESAPGDEVVGALRNAVTADLNALEWHRLLAAGVQRGSDNPSVILLLAGHNDCRECRRLERTVDSLLSRWPDHLAVVTHRAHAGAPCGSPDSGNSPDRGTHFATPGPRPVRHASCATGVFLNGKRFAQEAIGEDLATAVVAELARREASTVRAYREAHRRPSER